MFDLRNLGSSRRTHLNRLIFSSTSTELVSLSSGAILKAEWLDGDCEIGVSNSLVATPIAQLDELVEWSTRLAQSLLEFAETTCRSSNYKFLLVMYEIHGEILYHVVDIVLSRSDCVPQPGHDAPEEVCLLKMRLMSIRLPGRKLVSNGPCLSISLCNVRSLRAYSLFLIFRSLGQSRNRATNTESNTSHEFISSKCTGATLPRASVRMKGS